MAWKDILGGWPQEDNWLVPTARLPRVLGQRRCGGSPATTPSHAPPANAGWHCCHLPLSNCSLSPVVLPWFASSSSWSHISLSQFVLSEHRVQPYRCVVCESQVWSVQLFPVMPARWFLVPYITLQSAPWHLLCAWFCTCWWSQFGNYIVVYGMLHSSAWTKQWMILWFIVHAEGPQDAIVKKFPKDCNFWLLQWIGMFTLQ